MIYKIGDFSKISRLSIKTLRYYHECNLLVPTKIDKETGYRYYDEKCLDKAKIIDELKNLDFSLNEIKDILENYSEDDDITCFIQKKLDEVNSKLRTYQKIKGKLNNIIKQNEKDYIADDSKITIKDVPDLLIASIRYIGKLTEMGKILEKLFKNCGSNINGKSFCLYHDGEYKENDADLEICVPVSNVISNDEASSRELKGGRAVSYIYKGSYMKIGPAYKKVIDYTYMNNLKILIPTREVYIKGPGIIFKGNPNKYVTEIQIMIE